MSTDSSKSPVSANGWIAAVLLTLLAFFLYYLPLPFPHSSIYISLARQWEKNFLFQANDTKSTLQANDANGRCRVFFKGPKQVVDFAENEFILVFQNSGGEDNKSDGEDCKWSVRIIVNVEPEASILIPIEVVDVEATNQPKRIYTQQFPVEYDLKEFETKTIRFRLLVPPGIYNNLERPVTITLQDTASRRNILWDDTNCITQEAKGPNEEICLNIDLASAIRESAVENLLLPPWSNRLIPFIAFAMVWLAEQVIHKQKLWSEQPPNAWLLVLVALGAYFLFLFYAILYFILLADKLPAALLFAVLFVLCIITLPKLFSRGDQ